MEYPQSFPKHLQPPVDAAIAEAECKFIKAKQNLPVSRYGYAQAVEKLIERYIEEVLFAFAEQACKAVAEGLWSGEQIRSELDEFLRRLIINAYYEKKFDWADRLEYFDRDLRQRIKESDDWLKLQEKLAALARAQAAGELLNPAETEKANGKRCVADGCAANSEAKFCGRASWLAERLRERGWSKHDLERHSGPDHKTVQRVLDGFPVREDVLGKLANALSMKKTKVDLLDIPQN